jgi:hypothetical protein
VSHHFQSRTALLPAAKGTEVGDVGWDGDGRDIPETGGVGNWNVRINV